MGDQEQDDAAADPGPDPLGARITSVADSVYALRQCLDGPGEYRDSPLSDGAAAAVDRAVRAGAEALLGLYAAAAVPPR